MNIGLYFGALAMTAGERRLDAITNNLANLSTPAYKRLTTATFSEIDLRQRKGSPVLRTEQRTDFHQGVLERTDYPYDLALMGEGYFVVEGPQGPLYTRNGAFRLDDRGTLQTMDGQMVAWEGPRARIDPVGAPVTIDAKGAIHQGGKRLGQLAVVQFADQTGLRERSGSLYEAPPDVLPTPSMAEVHQGAIERSNVNPVDELVQMVAVQRNFDSVTRVSDLIDQSYRRLNGNK